MAKLSTYQSIEEKEEFFTVRGTIKTKNEFDDFFETLSEEKGSIWRGSGESEFKIYTFLQRFWIQRDLPNDPNEVLKYLKSIDEIARKESKGLNEDKGLLEEYFENYGIKNIGLFSILSILRHHEAPTPLIDFSRNPLVALYFAASSSNLKFTEKEIEKNFSLYELTSNHPIVKRDIKSPAHKYFKVKEPESKNLNKIVRSIDNSIKDAEEYVNDDRFIFDVLLKNNMAVRIEDSVNNEIKFYIKNNYNITNQKGLFIFNSNPIEPLENVIIKHLEINSETSNPSNNKNNFICYEIDKNLKEYILKKLEDKGIDNDFIYPNLYKITDKILKKHLQK